MQAIFIISLLGSFVMFILGIVRFVLNGVIAEYKHDTKTPYRKRKNHGVLRHWIITAILVLLALSTMGYV